MNRSLTISRARERAALLALLAGASMLLAAGEGLAQISFRGSSREAAVANVASHRSSGAVVVANSGNVTANMPSGFVEGDFLLAVIEAKDNVAVSLPSGWTAIAGSPQTIGATHRASLFWKIARRSDGGTVTITHTGGGEIMARVHAFQGVNQFTLFDGTPVLTANALVDSVVANGLTTETAGGLLIATMQASERTDGSPSVPSPWTLENEDSNNAGSNGIAIALATRTAPGAGTLGSVTSTRNAPIAPATGAQIALQPPLTIDKPAGTVAGDVLIAGIAVRESSSLTLTPPSGWSIVRRINSPGGSFPSTLAVYWRAAVAGEPNQYTFTVSGGTTTGIVGVIQAFAGVDTVDPIVVENGQATGSSFSHTAPSITPTVPNTMLVSNYHFISGSTWSVPTTSPVTTEANEVSSFEVFDTLGISMMGAYAPGPAANVAAGTRTAQATSNASTNAESGAAHILALRPALATLASFQVTSAATASTCVAQPVVIRARDAVGNTLTAYTGTVSLSTSTGTGGWAASGTSGPVVENGNANDGIASYTFRAADNGQATLLLANQAASNLTVTAADSVNAAATGVPTAVAFRDNAFLVEDDLSSLVAGAGVAVAGRPHDMRVTLWRRDTTQTPANCAVADTYAGLRSLKA